MKKIHNPNDGTPWDGISSFPQSFDPALGPPIMPEIGVSLDPEKVAKYSQNWRRLFES